MRRRAEAMGSGFRVGLGGRVTGSLGRVTAALETDGFSESFKFPGWAAAKPGAKPEKAMPTLLLDPGLTAMMREITCMDSGAGEVEPRGPMTPNAQASGGPDSDGFVMDRPSRAGPGALGDPQVQSLSIQVI
jgi:hypothetical protein